MMKGKRPLFAGLAVVLVAVVVLVLAVSGGSAKRARPQVAAGSAVSVTQTPLGKTLVDANGRTLYLFRGDKPGVSTVSQAGLAVWPAFTTTGTPQAKDGPSATQISTIAGPGGTRQVTYNGHPLYYYVGDHKPGDTRGQGLNQFGALWYVLSPSGNAVTSAPSTAPPSSMRSNGAYSSGY
jgi:predicted lipoprotein with Yx(FWY)xxD motif